MTQAIDFSRSRPFLFENPGIKVSRISKPTSIRFQTKPSRGISTAIRIQRPVENSQTPFLNLNMSIVLHFGKYSGGPGGPNYDFILVDNRQSLTPIVTPEQAVNLRDRFFGIGANGVVLVIFAIPGSNLTDYIFNPDGSEPEMCGNGVRCFVRFIEKLEHLNGRQSFKVHTGAGLIVREIHEDEKVRSEPILKASGVLKTLALDKYCFDIKAKLVGNELNRNLPCDSMGNPHNVTFGAHSGKDLVVELNFDEIDLKFKPHAIFPAEANREFVQFFSPSQLESVFVEVNLVVASGPTLACESGACAVVAAAAIEDAAEKKITVHMAGGPLDIEWSEDDNPVYLTGPAEAVFGISL